MSTIVGRCRYCHNPQELFEGDFSTILPSLISHLNIWHKDLDLGFLIIGGVIRIAELSRELAEQILIDIQITNKAD